MKVSKDLLQKYDRPGPRYTSYPTAPNWRDEYGPTEHAHHLRAAGAESGEGLSLYVHIPFCEALCVYCGCSTVITKRRERGPAYVGRVLREAELVRAAFGADADRPVVQHHWGGGTPTYLMPEDLARLFLGLKSLFPVAADAEVSIEVDPRVTSVEQLEVLREVGFHRISMGVQDFDLRVQQAIHRVQSFEQTHDLVAAARRLGFDSVNLDLVYGLPYQEQAQFEHSIARTLSLEPDRVACYGYAHVPWLKRHQNAIPEEALPTGADKLALYLATLDAFRAGGYEPIGMDHFAKTDDPLAQAVARGGLHRNFQGYTTRPAEDLIAFGSSAISEVDGAFAQNQKAIVDWEQAVDASVLPTQRGLARSADDAARRRIILDLMCRFRLDYDAHGGVEAFVRTYGTAIDALEPMQEDGLVEFDDAGITITGLGRLFVRNACMPFDAYLGDQPSTRPMFSRTV